MVNITRPRRPRTASMLAAVALVASVCSITAAQAAGHQRGRDCSGLATQFDNIGISNNWDTPAADLDGTGHSLSAQDLENEGWYPGTVITVGGAPLQWPDAQVGTPDNVAANGQRIGVCGSGTALSFLLASTSGNTSGSGTITYTDGSTKSYQLSVPDWYTGPTDTMTLLLPHWNTITGPQTFPMKLYTFSVPIDASKSVASVTLPTISAGPGNGVPTMHVFSIGIRPSSGQWAGTWTAALDDGIVPGPWSERTLRMVEHSSIGGSKVRIRLDNDFGISPVTIGHATIAVQGSASSATATPVTLTFGGAQQTTLPAGGQAISDPAGFTVPPDTNLLVSLYLPGPVQLAPQHSLGMQDMYSTSDQAGDHTTDVADYPVNNLFGFWTILSGIDVFPTQEAGTVVALGDSITDGFGSSQDGNNRWPNDLARRLLGQTQYPQMGVVDEGISANQVVHDLFNGTGTGSGGISALARTDRDVLSQTGVRTVIVLEGINDVKAGTPPDQVIAGLTQIADEAHAYGLRIIAATITPFKGYGAYTAQYEANRQQVNSFIRSNGGVFDGVVDFDAVIRDPGDPQAMLPAYDSGDHLHPGPAGYQAMANAVNLADLG